MKRFAFMVLLLANVLIAGAQVGVGIRDSRYAFAGFRANSGLYVQLDHSLYSTRFPRQYIRPNVGYSNTFMNDKLGVYGVAFAGINYQTSFFNAGADIKASYQCHERLAINATFYPIYDSFFDFQPCYQGGINVKAHKNVGILAEYTTVPVYRESEQRVRVGADFRMGEHKNGNSLQATPLLSFPVEKEERTMRIEVSIKYNF